MLARNEQLRRPPEASFGKIGPPMTRVRSPLLAILRVF